MTQINNYNYSEKEISFILSDSTGGEYVWVGFKTDGSNCALQKVSAHNPLQKYFDIDVAITEFKKAFISGSYIYFAINDSTNIVMRYDLASPVKTPISFAIPAGITEVPVDIVVTGSVVFILIPGDVGGTNTKIVKMTTSGTFTETIDLPTVTNASSLTLDSVTGDLWVSTYTAPATYIRVYEDGGWNYTINS